MNTLKQHALDAWDFLTSLRPRDVFGIWRWVVCGTFRERDPRDFDEWA